MNEDVLKPFPCKEVDCGMGFFTEDHLSAHYQAKHGKLNLEIPRSANLIFADQTPTPTRLLNNCEELRVFDDLQNINPFEEGFRRAVEDGSGSIHDCNLLGTPSNQDTLHTPQILPHFDNRTVKSEPDFPTQEEPENLTIPTTLEDAINIPNTSQSSECNNQRIAPKPQTNPLPKIIYATSISNATALKLAEGSMLDICRSNESVKDKLKNIILNNSGQQSNAKRRKLETVPAILIGAVPIVASSANLIITSDTKKTKTESNGSTKPTEVINKLNDSQKTTKPPAAVLKVERNRAAARRYRNKMKIQSQSLQEKYEKSQRDLNSMRKEMTDLKKELTELKALLLLHKDCTVSRAMTSKL